MNQLKVHEKKTLKCPNRFRRDFWVLLDVSSFGAPSSAIFHSDRGVILSSEVFRRLPQNVQVSRANGLVVEHLRKAVGISGKRERKKTFYCSLLVIPPITV